MESLVCDFVSVIVRGVNWLLIGGIALFIYKNIYMQFLFIEGCGGGQW